MYLRKKIEAAIEKTRPFIEGKYLKDHELVDIFKKKLSRFGVYFTIEENPTYRPEEFGIGGFYDPTSDWKTHKERDIEIVFVVRKFTYANDKKRTYLFDKITFENTKNVLLQTIQHEAIHRMQNERRRFKLKLLKNTTFIPNIIDEKSYTKEQKIRYLSNPDEIDAYGHDVALELEIAACGFIFLHARKMDMFYTVSPSLRTYIETFKTIEHPIVQKLLRQAKKWIKSNKND